MPVTPLHPPAAWIPYLRRPRAFSFWALTFGSMVNDLEYPFAWALTGDLSGGRGVMHSLLGVLTLNAVVAVLAVRLLLPPFLGWVARRWPDHPEVFRFAGHDLRNDPRDARTLYASAVLGGLTHLVLDLPMHGYNPVLWPWQPSPFSILPFADDPVWDVVVEIPFVIVLVWTLRRYWRR